MNMDDHLTDEMKIRVKQEAMEIIMRYHLARLGDRADLMEGMGETPVQPEEPPLQGGAEAIPQGGIDNALH